jgi:hypothetical protein
LSPFALSLHIVVPVRCDARLIDSRSDNSLSYNDSRSELDPQPELVFVRLVIILRSTFCAGGNRSPSQPVLLSLNRFIYLLIFFLSFQCPKTQGDVVSDLRQHKRKKGKKKSKNDVLKSSWNCLLPPHLLTKLNKKSS